MCMKSSASVKTRIAVPNNTRNKKQYIQKESVTIGKCGRKKYRVTPQRNTLHVRIDTLSHTVHAHTHFYLFSKKVTSISVKVCM